MKANLLNWKVCMLCLMAVFGLSVAQAQVIVKGNVQDVTGEPLTGVTVQEMGATGGTITDIDGNYSLQVKNPQATLVFRYTGMATQEIKLAGRKTLDVTLKEDLANLEEVVVVGYGTMKKSDLAGASVSMDESKMKQSIISSLDQSLQGRAAGVQAMQTSGAPGSSSSIRVRGQATINSNAEPLYVIDGVIVQTHGTSGADYGLGDKLGNGAASTISPLSTINPADIVSMEILKDASATAIYGAQGANGVVLITTKRGKAGEAKFTYDGMLAWNRQTKRLDMMNLREFANFYNTFVEQGEVSDPSSYYNDPSLLGVGTNWQDEVFQTAFQQQHQFSAQGGNEKVKYYVSGGMMDQDGTLIGSDFKRFSLRANLDAELKSWLKMGLNVSYNNTKENLLKADQDEGIITYALTSSPAIPVYNVDGTYSSVSQEGYSNPNPIALALEDDIKLKRQEMTGNIFFDVTPYKKVTWHAEYDWSVGSSRGDVFSPMLTLGTWSRTTNENRIQKNSSTYWSVKNYVTYADSYGKHSYTVMGGQEAWESVWDYSAIYNTALPSNEVQNPTLGDGTPSIGYGQGSSSMASFYARATYNYDNRYLGTYTWRYDGSSNFGPKNRWAAFNSFALAWRFTQESFLKDVDWLSNGKLRFGWGQTGNANIGGYLWGSPLSIMESDLGKSYRPKQIANTSIKWETQEQFNVGLDLSFLNDRINLVVEWYNKESKDMLMQLQLPSYMGTSGNGSSALSAPYGNYGSIRNRGWEFTLNARPVETKNFDWSTEATLSINRNKLVSLNDGTGNVSLIGYGMWTDVVTLSEVGESLYNFYGYQVEGVYQDFDDILNSPKAEKYPANGVFDKATTVWPGDLKFKDVNNDGVINEKDRTNIGSPLPKFTFGWNNTFHYKNWDASIFINGSYGGKVFNYLKMKLTHMNSTWTNQLVDVADRAVLAPIDATKNYSAGVDRGDGNLVYNWYNDVTNVRVSNPNTKTPRASIQDPNDNDRISDRYIEDGSYIRLKNISIGYTFDKKLIRKLHIDNLRVYANIQNLLTITSYDGYDPEVGVSTASQNVYGLDNGRYPSPTTYSVGLSVSF